LEFGNNHINETYVDTQERWRLSLGTKFCTATTNVYSRKSEPRVRPWRTLPGVL